MNVVKKQNTNLEDEYDKIDKQELRALESDAKVRELISSANKVHKVIKVGDIDVRIRAYMPRIVRLRLMKAGNELKKVNSEETITKVERMMYPIVADMCLDPPYNNPKTWEIVDEETGVVQTVLFDIMEAVNKTEKDVETFRQE